MSIDISKLFLRKDDKNSNDYKSGWDDAICYVLDNFKVETRKGEAIQITFELDEEYIIKRIMENQCLKN